MSASPIDLLLRLLDQGYNRKAWHGPNLRGSLRGIEPVAAAWRPGPGRRNIWEIAIHAAYWKYIVRRRLIGERRGSFPLKGSNWFPRPTTVSQEAWEADVALLGQMHRALCEAVAGLQSSDLQGRPAGSKVSNLDMIAGVAAHDVYHAGQIQLLKRLALEAPKR
jgi:hypothetical protein